MAIRLLTSLSIVSLFLNQGLVAFGAGQPLSIKNNKENSKVVALLQSPSQLERPIYSHKAKQSRKLSKKWATRLRLKPRWYQGVYQVSKDSSYLHRLETPESEFYWKFHPEPLREWVFTPDALDHAGGIVTLTRDYDFKSKYALIKNYDMRDYIEKNQRYTKDFVLEKLPANRTGSLQKQAEVGLEKSIDKRSQVYKDLAPTVGVATVAVSTTLGIRPLIIKMGPLGRLESRTNIRTESGEWTWKVMGFENQLALQAPEGGFFSGKKPPAGPVSPGNELMRASAAREIPLPSGRYWSMGAIGSEVIYGGSSKTVWANLNRRLSKNWTCSYSYRMPTHLASTTDAERVRTVRLNYEIHF